MSETVSDARRLTFSNLDQLWSRGAPLIIPVKGEPLCDLEFDPPGKKITLVTDYQTPEPDLAQLQNITYQPMCIDGRDVALITVRTSHGPHGPYGLLASIADQLQLTKSPLTAAVANGVKQFKDILAARVGLTPQEEIGLFGELIFLEFLMKTIGSGPATAAWQGPHSEEHDFSFPEIDLEVKTTSSEDRRHTIAGLGQLVPRVGTQLAMVSIQITRVGDDEGETLPGLVRRVRTLAGGHVVDIDPLLAEIGWCAEDADLYSTRWALRSIPRAYVVGPEFPAITAKALAASVPNAELVSDVSYRVDVTNVDFHELPEPLSGFTE